MSDKQRIQGWQQRAQVWRRQIAEKPMDQDLICLGDRLAAEGYRLGITRSTADERNRRKSHYRGGRK